MKKLLFLLGFSSSVFGGTMANVSSLPTGWVLTGNLGPAWTNAGQTQTILLLPNVEKAYVADKFTRTLMNGEVFLGYQGNVLFNAFGQLGIAYGFTNNAKLTGNVWEDADPDFNNFYYQYNAFFSHVTIKGKLLKQLTETLSPYIAASVGVGFNRASRFSLTPIITEEIPAPLFSSHSITDSFAYTFEAGIQKTITQHVFLGLGYHFADWGKSLLGPALGQSTEQSIQLNHFYTNGLQFNLTVVS
ncbi:MAG: porin family protein [Legionellaceae bacterium]|nr:porin family protein [Legionellaceae bacterium]